LDEPDKLTRAALAAGESGDEDPSFLKLLRAALRDERDRVERAQTDTQAVAGAWPAERIGRFEVISMLGRGGYGTVLRVLDTQLGCERAMKLPNAETLASERSLARFIDEARKAVLIDHPNVVRVVEADVAGSVYYMVMEYCPAGSLAGWLAGRPVDRPIPPRWAAALVAEIADGVQQAHAAGLLHRDLKPGNVMLVRIDDRNEIDPPRFHPKVGDFGLAKALGDGGGQMYQTASGAMVGTLAYMSPEQARGDKKINAATDVYSLGAILYQLLTRTPPHWAPSEAEVLSQILSEAPPRAPRALRPDLPRDLDAICRTALAKRASDRYTSAAELADDLRRYLRNDPVKGSPWWKRARATVLRHRWKAAIAAGLAAAAVTASGVWLHIGRLRREADREVLLHELEVATVAKLPTIVPRLDLSDPEVPDRLNRLFVSGSPAAKLGAALALLPIRPEFGNVCYEGLVGASPADLVPLARFLALKLPELPTRLAAELKQESTRMTDPSDEARDRRKAIAACSLVALEPDGVGWSLLRFDPEPQARSFLIHLLGPAGTPPRKILERLDVEPDVSTRRALILCLGEVPEAGWPDQDRSRAVATLLSLYERDPDSGIHGAAKWLLARLGCEDAMRAIDRRLRGRPELPGGAWRIGPLDLTFITVDSPALDFVFEITDTEITVDRFLAYCPAHEYDATISPGRHYPINAVSYDKAAAFCNWLGDCEGLGPEDWCYTQGAPYPDSLESVPHYHERTGYRVPDLAEFLEAARAGARSPSYFGSADAFIPRYVWSSENSTGTAQPVGRLKPNEIGLFDMLGNMREWCEISPWVRGARNQPVAGSCFLERTALFKVFGAQPSPKVSKSFAVQSEGFRVARTVKRRARAEIRPASR
jgi:hypothetical protein